MLKRYSSTSASLRCQRDDKALPGSSHANRLSGCGDRAGTRRNSIRVRSCAITIQTASVELHDPLLVTVRGHGGKLPKSQSSNGVVTRTSSGLVWYPLWGKRRRPTRGWGLPLSHRKFEAIPPRKAGIERTRSPVPISCRAPHRVAIMKKMKRSVRTIFLVFLF